MSDFRFFAAITIAAFRDCLALALAPVAALAERIDTRYANALNRDEIQP